MRGIIEAQHPSVASRTTDSLHTPSLASPPASRTPPTFKTMLQTNGAHLNSRAGSEPVDAKALTKALKTFEGAGYARERTPGGSPSRKRQRVYGDRSVWCNGPESGVKNDNTVAADSSPIVKDKIFKRASACSMMMVHRQHRRKRRKGLRMVSFIFRKVGQQKLSSSGIWRTFTKTAHS